MSKRNLIIILAGSAVILTVSLGVTGRMAGWFGDPVFTDEIPAKRPKRPDHRQLELFSGKSINEIIEILMTETAPKGTTETPAAPFSPALLGMLPDAPLPFPAEAAPRDADGLGKFVDRFKRDPALIPTPEEQWQLNLALAALQTDQLKTLETTPSDTHPAPESETFPVRLVPRESALFGPFTLGSFREETGIDVIAGGGSALHSIAAEGAMHTDEGLAAVPPGNGVYPGDFDGDGRLDLFITRGEGLPNSLLRNEGGGEFEDVTIALGLLSFSDTTSAAWLDYDGDGLLDLLVGSLDHPLELYHQTSGGIFQPIAWDLQLWVPRGVRTMAVSDFSGDGHPDFFLGMTGTADRLYLAKPAGNWSESRFDNVAPISQIDRTDSATATFFDFDNDGHTDLVLVPHSAEKIAPMRLLRNGGDGDFSDVTAEAGLDNLTGISAVGIADLDNDSYEDLIIGTGPLSLNRVFWNREGAGFKEVTIVSGGGYLDEPVSYAVADLEGNGTPDILSRDRTGKVRWLEASGAIDSWVSVKVNRAPPGFRVVLSVRDKDWVLRDIERRPGMDAAVIIGIGQAEVIERLSVFPPEGGEALHVIEKIEPNRVIVIDLPESPRQRPVVPLHDKNAPAATTP